MHEGPLRQGTYLDTIPASGSHRALASVALEDGSLAYIHVPDKSLAESLRPGDRVVIKPNVGWNRLPQQAANSNPDVVAELAALYDAWADRAGVMPWDQLQALRRKRREARG